jgi:hypothetical protein
MKHLGFVLAALLITIPAWAQVSHTYLIALEANQDRTVELKVPAGKSDIQIASMDSGAIYVVKMYDANGDPAATCQQISNGHTVPCIIHTNEVPNITKVKLQLTNKTDLNFTINVQIFPSQ